MRDDYTGSKHREFKQAVYLQRATEHDTTKVRRYEADQSHTAILGDIIPSGSRKGAP